MSKSTGMNSVVLNKPVTMDDETTWEKAITLIDSLMVSQGQPLKVRKPSAGEEELEMMRKIEDATRGSTTFPNYREGDSIDKVNDLFRKGSMIGVTIYISLLFIALRFSPVEQFENPTGIEQSFHFMTFLLLFVTNGSRFIPLLMRNSRSIFVKSGLLRALLTVQGVAMSSNLIMAFLPTPIYFDTISGMRVHIVRWMEWTALAFLMAFLTDNIDAPIRNLTVKYRTATMVSASTVFGAFFPFCKTLTSWLGCFFISWLLFFEIYVHLWARFQRYRKLRKSRKMRKQSATTQETNELVRSSFMLSLACTCTWTMLAVTFSVAAIGPKYFPNHSILGHPALQETSMCMFEVASKIWYLSAIIDAYEKVFDETTRSVRRLEELRDFMSAVWESSSDVIVFCAHTKEHTSARISPAFLKTIGYSTGCLSFLDRGDISLVLDIYPARKQFHVFAIDLDKPITREDAERLNKSVHRDVRSLDILKAVNAQERSLAVMANLAVESSRCSLKDGEINLTRALYTTGLNGNESTIRCEAKMARLEDDNSIIVLRDISDRFQRFETEKKLLEEITIRKKDTEANRFTRHEVKNGILSTIGLLEHLKELIDKQNRPDPRASAEDLQRLLRHSESQVDEVGATFNELDSTLRDILDTILDEAMAREIIYGEYRPKKEKMNVPDVLESLRRRSSGRFPLFIDPEPFPTVDLDRHLLRYIYRNAVSNACKYGQLDGVVETRIRFDPHTNVLTMEVTNLPGMNHEELILLSPEEVQSVFHPGVQLEATREITECRMAHLHRNQSSGNGAWIMQKCAESLDGFCSIRFEQKRTVFSFSCKVKSFGIRRPSQVHLLQQPFHLPANTWGIVIDDSKIQRKLLERLLKLSSIPENRRLILGQDSNEIYGFIEKVTELIRANPLDTFLIIADENLDVIDGGAVHETVSGSKIVHELIQGLSSEEDKRLLALIRSANDSAADIELYLQRAHGYLLKEPLRKEKITDLIAPWWYKRFPNTDQGVPQHIDPLSDDEMFSPSAEDIKSSMTVIDALISVDHEQILEKRWRAIRDKLHALKGDLMTLKAKESIADIMKVLDGLVLSNERPSALFESWHNIKQMVSSLVMS